MARRNNRPPQSERPGRGALIDPNKAEYSPVTGKPGRFYTPDRSMTVGTRNRTPLPVSEFGGGNFNVQTAARKRLNRSR